VTIVPMMRWKKAASRRDPYSGNFMRRRRDCVAKLVAGVPSAVTELRSSIPTVKCFESKP
jgi:hypothetical protein